MGLSSVDMRYLTILVQPAQGRGFHPLGQELSTEPAINREAIHNIELLADDTVLLFAEGTGDKDRYEEIMQASEYVIDYLVSGSDPWFAVSHFEPTDLTHRVLESKRESDIVIETPIQINHEGALRITYLGSEEGLQQLFADVGEESALSVEVLETGEYEPDLDGIMQQLTARQREVLHAAVEAGYYCVPRKATHEDVAEAVGIAAPTIGEHLRKIEARVFSALAR